MDKPDLEKIAVENESKRKRFNFRFWAVIMIVNLGVLQLGTVVVWTSPALPDLEEKQPFDSNLTITQKSWIASAPTLGAVFSGPAAGYVMDNFGRVKSLAMLGVPMLIGWIMIAFSPTAAVMIVGRFLLGLSIGGLPPVCCCYLAEASQEKIRGFVMGLCLLMMGAGQILVYVLGTFFSWFVLSVICGIITIIFFALLWIVPESPVHLAHKGNSQAAAESLMKLRGKNCVEDVSTELNLLLSSCSQSQTQAESLNESGSLWKRLTRRGTMKAIIICTFLQIFQQFSGLNAVVFFTADIFFAAKSNLEPNVAAIIIGCVVFVAGIFSTLLIDRIGRRKLLFVSLLGDAICQMALAVFFLLQSKNDGETPAGTGWVPLASLMGFMIMNNIGIGPLAWFLMSELIPTDVKGAATAALTSFNWALAFAVTKTFEDISNDLGSDACFWFFAGVCIFGVVFCTLFVPETKGKTLDEIQKEYFHKQ